MNGNNRKNSSFMLWHFLIFFKLVIIVDARLRQNNAELAVSCDNSAMNVQMTFRHPFRGVVFIPEHYYDPTCSYGVSPNSSALQITLTLPHDSCKMRILNTSNKLIGFNTIAIFHHRMLETIYDYIQNVTCELKYPIKDLNKNIWTEPVLNTWLSFENPFSVLPENIVDKMGLEDALLLVYNIKDRGLYRDMEVMNCIGHDHHTVNKKTSFYQMSDPFGCSTDSDLVSNFTTFRDPLYNSKMIAYATVKNFSMIVRRRLYVTCGAKICKDRCDKKCGEIDQRKDFYFSDIATKSLANRPEGSVRPASLTAFERFDRQRRSHSDADLIRQYDAEEQSELLLEKLNAVSSGSVNQSDVATNQTIQMDQYDTTLSSKDPEEHSRSKRAIKEIETELTSPEMNIIVMKSNDANNFDQSEGKVVSVLNKNTESFLSNSSDIYEYDSVIKIKMSFEPKHSSKIDEKNMSDKFNFSSILRALVSIFALICISGACYFLFSFRKHLNVESTSNYASQPYI